MDYHYFKDKLNRFYDAYIGREQRPTFFEIDEICPELHQITDHFLDIKKEFETLIQSRITLPRYHDIDPGEVDISNACEKQWNVFMLHLLGYDLAEADMLCPSTQRLLKHIPGMIQAFFSILEPGKSIPLHEGPYRGYLRYHLGIQVPVHNPPHIVVNKQPYTWKEGKAILFDDSWPHEVINHSDSLRAVLIIDILRPMPRVPHAVNRFVTQVIARQFYGKPVIKKAKQHSTSIVPLMQ